MAKEKAAKKVMKKKPIKVKKKRSVSSGVAHVKATFNNTIITITDPHGKGHQLEKQISLVLRSHQALQLQVQRKMLVNQ